MSDPDPDTDGVGVRPGVRSIALYKSLNYKAWYALAEFVDNSIQSYMDNRTELRRRHGDDFFMEVDITVGPGADSLTVRDNAAGIRKEDYARAFRPAEPPPERQGLSEFGMGMKSAACWFAPVWTVRTSAVDEPLERLIQIDVPKLVDGDVETVKPTLTEVDALAHYTEIQLTNLHHPLRGGRTIGKIKDHLASIYRQFLKDGEVKIRYNGELLIYEEPEMLNASHHAEDAGDSLLWRKDLNFKFGDNLIAEGFAALRAVGSTTQAGFALFRRRRIIVGSADEGYRPHYIFGSGNSYRSQRLFGELEILGAEVSHTKDAFAWGDAEEDFLVKLKEALKEDPIDLLDQAENYRSGRGPRSGTHTRREALGRAMRAATKASKGVSETLQQAKMDSKDTEELAINPPIAEPDESMMTVVMVDDTKWHIEVELTSKPEMSEWLEMYDQTRDKGTHLDRERHLLFRFNLVHPFMQRFEGATGEGLDALFRLGIAVGMAELIARDGGAKKVILVRKAINNLLRGPLSKA